MACRLKSWPKNRTTETQNRPCRGTRLIRSGLTLLEPGLVAEHSGPNLSCHTHTHTEWGRNRNQSSTSPCYTCNILDLSSPGVWPQHDQLQSDPWQPILQEKMKFKLTCKKKKTLHQSSLPCFSSGFIYKKNREMNTCFSQEVTHPTKRQQIFLRFFCYI